MSTRADDSLLQSLLALCRYHGTASTAEALLAGLPLENGRLTPTLFERAAARVGLASRIVYKRADAIEPAAEPAVCVMFVSSTVYLRIENTRCSTRNRA